MVASPDGKFLFVGVGSNSNVGENGLEMEKGRAAIWMIDAKTGAYRIFASGLRNPVGIAWNPWSRQLWTSVNERDEIGNDLVPDYMTSVRDGGFYGWPWSYYGQTVDTRLKPPRPDMVAKAITPDYALGPHTASLGLTFSEGAALGPQYRARRVRRPARLVEPQAAVGLQGHLRAVRRRAAVGQAGRRADRLPRRRRRLRPPGRRDHRARRQPARRRRRRRQGVARQLGDAAASRSRRLRAASHPVVSSAASAPRTSLDFARDERIWRA